MQFTAYFRHVAIDQVMIDESGGRYLGWDKRKMAVLVNSETRIVLQVHTNSQKGLPSSYDRFFTSNVVGHVSSGGCTAANMSNWLLEDVPAFPTLDAAILATGANASIIIAESELAVGAITDAIAARIPLVVVVSYDISQEQRQRVQQLLDPKQTLLIGPGFPEIVSPGECHIGAIPNYICAKGGIGILSESGVLSSEVALQTTALGLGQSTVISLGRDPLDDASFSTCLHLLLSDDATNGIALILDDHSQLNDEAFTLLASRNREKPVVAHFAERNGDLRDPPVESKSLVSFADGVTARTIQTLQNLGVIVTDIPASIGIEMKAALGRRRHIFPKVNGLHDFASAMRRVEQDIY